MLRSSQAAQASASSSARRFCLPGNLDDVVLDPGPYPFKGEVIWLTPEQGGRSTGVPEPSSKYSYAQVAHVPPHSAETGTASFVLRGWDPLRWRSLAEGKWLVVENAGDQLVTPEAVVVVAEGPRVTAILLVEQVDDAS